MRYRTNRSNRSVSLVAILVIAASCGCGGGYEYIAPISPSWVPSDIDNVELVSYRQLTRRDFRGDEPSLAYRAQKKKMAAQTVMYLSAPIIVDVIEIPSNPDSIRWETVIEEFQFKAIMVPEASWWNPKKNGRKDVERILEHEQVHFAITELEARKANDRMDELLARIRVNGPTEAETMSRALRRIQAEQARINLGLSTMHAKYDLETKNGLDKEAQKHWVERIERLMEEADTTSAFSGMP